MTTVHATPAASSSAPAEPEPQVNVITLEGVSWELYERLSEELAEQRLRLTYDDGTLTLMSPILSRHERIKSLLRRMVEAATEERNLPIATLGSTTWKKKKLRKGLEPDECYYIQNESKLRGRFDVDLRRDPPPDLVIEVDVTHHPVGRLKIYAALGVNEVWQHKSKRLTIFRRMSDLEYEAIERSIALPFLPAAEVQRFLDMFETTDENSVIRAFREWVRSLPA